MTGKQRVIRMLTGREADRVPRYDSFWEDTLISFREDGLDDMVPQKNRVISFDDTQRMIGNPMNDWFGFDIDMLYLDNSMRWPVSVDSEDHENMLITDRCGYQVRKIKHKSRTLELLWHAAPDRDAWQKVKGRFVLDPKDASRIDSTSFFLRHGDDISWDDASVLYKSFRMRENFILLNGYGPFEAVWRYHGYDQSLMDTALDPALMTEMFAAVTDLTIEVLSYALDQGIRPDGYWMIEDLGSTRSTLMSPESYRQLIWPFHKKLGDFLHDNNMYFFIHSCGYVESLIPSFIDAGIDVIQPLQANTGMDVTHLKKEYGNRITFWGNIDERMLSGGADSIEKEIRRKIPQAMEGGGYIYHSDHSIPPTVSLKDYLFLIKMLDAWGTC